MSFCSNFQYFSLYFVNFQWGSRSHWTEKRRRTLECPGRWRWKSWWKIGCFSDYPGGKYRQTLPEALFNEKKRIVKSKSMKKNMNTDNCDILKRNFHLRIANALNELDHAEKFRQFLEKILEKNTASGRSVLLVEFDMPQDLRKDKTVIGLKFSKKTTHGMQRKVIAPARKSHRWWGDAP